MLKAILLIGLGGGLGSLLRWFLSLSLNACFPVIPLGTLTANLLAGYLIGICLVIFISNPAIAPEWRLFIVTGCLGGLSTFSSFSAEVVTLFQEGRLLWGGVTILAHVIGSITMTFLGIATVTLCNYLLR